MKSIFVFAAFLAMASATSLNAKDFKNSEKSEERFFVSSGGSNYLTLNSTLLLGVIAALGLIVGIMVLAGNAAASARAQNKNDQQL